MAKDRVERPFRAQLAGTETLYLPTGEVDTQGQGEATHLGKYKLVGHGFVNLETGEASGSGFLTAANGDQIFIESTLQGGVSIMTFTGGTGRFEGATGTIIPTPTSTPIITTDPVAMTITLRGTYTAAGTITY
jgi:hypothetical protein